MSDEDDKIVCYICDKIEENPERIIECVQCAKSVHFRCKKLRGNAVLKAKKRPFYCSVDCADMFARGNQSSDDSNHLISEIKLLAQAVRESKQESAHLRFAFEQSCQKIDTLVKTTLAIEQSQDFMSKQFDVLQKDFDGFKQQLGGLQLENEKFRIEITDWKYKQGAVTSRLDHLEMEVDKMNRGKLSNNAVILGIPTPENENLKTLVIGVGKAVGCIINEDSVISARRLVGKNRNAQGAPILVTFSSPSIKEKLFEMKRSHGPLQAAEICRSFNGASTRLVIRDELTEFGRELYRETKELQLSM
ncbi:uncharacterized protein LOC134215650 [Armigeres subalbatus]|uniref:uncharacterized protein LOC134215650 n=1 Tax=Armigeres subalbatus TaxID=124917 RepID=UPI002ECFB9F2